MTGKGDEIHVNIETDLVCCMLRDPPPDEAIAA